jgi:serine/threonine-protein kinase
MAHAHGVVHGAITPTNLIVTPAGSVRLVDFAASPGALARRRGAPDALGRARGFRYTAPECRPDGPLAAGRASEQGDIWAVGECLRFALTGDPLPLHPTHDPCEDLSGRVPSALVGVLGLALARDPGSRYDTAYAMLGDVRRLLAGRSPKLQAAAGPVPASLVGIPAEPSSASGRRSFDPGPAHTPSTPGEWRGNLLLMLAIALLVGVATFVLVREKLADRPEVHEPR